MDIFGNPDILGELYDEDIASLIQLALDQVEELLERANGKNKRRIRRTDEQALLQAMREELVENAVALSDRLTARHRQKGSYPHSAGSDSDSDASSSEDDDPISWEEFSNLYRSWQIFSEKLKGSKTSDPESSKSSTKKPRRRPLIQKDGSLPTSKRSNSPLSTPELHPSSSSYPVEQDDISRETSATGYELVRTRTSPDPTTFEPGLPVTSEAEASETLLTDPDEEDYLPAEPPEVIHSRPVRPRIINRTLRPVTPEPSPPPYPEDIIKVPTEPDDQ
jgi:hypothetical protein